MHGEDLLVDDSGDGKTVETVGEGLPQLNVVTALALVVEAVDSVDGGTLVVATEDEEVLGVLDLVGQEQANGLEGLLTSVDVVTEEKVVGLWREAAVFEETEQIVVLTVDVTADLWSTGQSAGQSSQMCSSSSMSRDSNPRSKWKERVGKSTLIGASSSRRMG